MTPNGPMKKLRKSEKIQVGKTKTLKPNEMKIHRTKEDTQI